MPYLHNVLTLHLVLSQAFRASKDFNCIIIHNKLKSHYQVKGIKKLQEHYDDYIKKIKEINAITNNFLRLWKLLLMNTIT